jgi:gliding motility-associated lipoprotein GldJ
MKLNVLIYLVLSLMLAVSCNLIKGKKGGKSSTTGWSYNDPKNGGFEYQSGYQQPTGPGLVYIQGGTFTMGRVEQDVIYEANNTPRRVTVASFYMDECEVRNIDWREYLFWLQRVYPGKDSIYKAALPDTLVWRRDELAFNEPYFENYLRHAAYSEYPVVGVSWIKADRYCQWRTDRANEAILVDEQILGQDKTQKNDSVFTYDAYLNGLFSDTVRPGKRPMKSLADPKVLRRVNLSDGILLPRYQIPTEAQWEYAALGLIGKTEEEVVLERRIYPWDGNQIRNSSKKMRGSMMANNVRGRGDYMGTAGFLNDAHEITASVKSFEPNDYGLYCMAGNVNEWVKDVYRPNSSMDVNEFLPFRGNVYTNYRIDSLTGMPMKNSYGELIRDTAKIGANLINYGDGDYQTQLTDVDEWKQDTILVNVNGKMVKTLRPRTTDMYATGTGTSTPRISDRTRVYKGGGWKDRTYWLGPGTRRPLDERKSSNDLGFRCSMTHLGDSNSR